MLLCVSLTDAQREAVAVEVALHTTRLDRSAAGEVLTLQRAAWMKEARENGTLDIPPLVDTLDDVAASLSRPEVVVWGYRNELGRLLGTVRTSPAAAPGSSPGTADLGRLGVTPDMVGTGLGSALLTLAEARQPATVTRMNLITGAGSFSNHRFYAAHGWSLDPATPHPEGTVAFTKPRTIGSDRGIGPGVITSDGCAVEVYAALRAQNEPGLIAGAVPAGGSILELGCGTGRIADPLAADGFDVVGVDNSAEMLAHVSTAATALSPIVGYDGGRTFDAVVAASHLISSSDPAFVSGLLATLLRHLAPGGVAIFQWHTPAWHDELFVGATAAGKVGELASRLLITNAGTGFTAATVTYTRGDDRWIHEFVSPRIGDDDLLALLGTAGLTFDSWLTPNHGWFTARAT